MLSFCLGHMDVEKDGEMESHKNERVRDLGFHHEQPEDSLLDTTIKRGKSTKVKALFLSQRTIFNMSSVAKQSI